MAAAWLCVLVMFLLFWFACVWVFESAVPKIRCLFRHEISEMSEMAAVRLRVLVLIVFKACIGFPVGSPENPRRFVRCVSV
jgi:hypothetical protein